MSAISSRRKEFRWAMTMMNEQQATGLLATALTRYDYPASYLNELQHYLDISQSPNILDTKKQSLLQHVLFSLSKQVPVEYLVGRALFYERYFRVTRDVLIPRFDTEILVTKVIEILRNTSPTPATIIDIGTGSGAIIVSLAIEFTKFVNNSFVAIEPSAAALAIAMKNAEEYGVAAQITFQHTADYPKDVAGNPLIPETQHVIIVSNPPYISADHFSKLPESVKAYEPHIALQEQESFIPALQSYVDLLKVAEKNVHVLLEYNDKKGQMINLFLGPQEDTSSLNEVKSTSS